MSKINYESYLKEAEEKKLIKSRNQTRLVLGSNCSINLVLEFRISLLKSSWFHTWNNKHMFWSKTYELVEPYNILFPLSEILHHWGKTTRDQLSKNLFIWSRMNRIPAHSTVRDWTYSKGKQKSCTLYELESQNVNSIGGWHHGS